MPGGTSPHADSRAMVFDHNQNLLEGDDGGIYRLASPADDTGAWTSVNGNLQVMEIHDIAYDNVSHIIIAGTQDNGTQMQQASGDTQWELVKFADGGDVAVDDVSLLGLSTRYYSRQFLGGFTRVPPALEHSTCDLFLQRRPFDCCHPASCLCFEMDRAFGEQLIRLPVVIGVIHVES